MPDISVAYKLLLESGQQVNIYDWLVAFNTIVGDNDPDNDEIPAEIQFVLRILSLFNYQFNDFQIVF